MTRGSGGRTQQLKQRLLLRFPGHYYFFAGDIAERSCYALREGKNPRLSKEIAQFRPLGQGLQRCRPLGRIEQHRINRLTGQARTDFIVGIVQ